MICSMKNREYWKPSLVGNQNSEVTNGESGLEWKSTRICFDLEMLKGHLNERVAFKFIRWIYQ